jgi:CubicO group peptidase (beta-lactamase class C family)
LAFFITLNAIAQPDNGGTVCRKWQNGSFSIGSVESIMIERGGEIIHQDFRGRMNPNRSTNIKSASKSIISLLIGIAIHEGYIDSINEPIGSIFRNFLKPIPIP